MHKVTEIIQAVEHLAHVVKPMLLQLALLALTLIELFRFVTHALAEN